MKDALLVFLGGGIGSILRFYIGRLNLNTFPYGTMLVNVLGAFLLGVVIALFGKQIINNSTKSLVAIGLCGGFTTWSSFSLESFNLIKKGQWELALIYSVGSFALSMIMIFIPYKFFQG